ncbi:MAG: hypothetical protein Q4F57_02515 [Weeksellaceae bacterium]|nr:hypothetical protein [Weeksellaceae bacterium]
MKIYYYMKNLMLLLSMAIGGALYAQDRAMAEYNIFRANECYQLLAAREFEASLYNYDMHLVSHSGAAGESLAQERYDAWTRLVLVRCDRPHGGFARWFPFVWQYDVGYRESQVLTKFLYEAEQDVTEVWDALRAKGQAYDMFLRILYYELYRAKNVREGRDYELERRYALLNAVQVQKEDFEAFHQFFDPPGIIAIGPAAGKESADTPAYTDYVPLVSRADQLSENRTYQRDEDYYTNRQGVFTRKPIWTKKHDSEINAMRIPEGYCVRMLVAFGINSREAIGQRNYQEIVEDVSNTYHAKYMQLVHEGLCEGSAEENYSAQNYIDK